MADRAVAAVLPGQDGVADLEACSISPARSCTRATAADTIGDRNHGRPSAPAPSTYAW
ncbi:MAG: hypothetical protein R2939_17875 [Kofleriaceae bacterium]